MLGASEAMLALESGSEVVPVAAGAFCVENLGSCWCRGFAGGLLVPGVWFKPGGRLVAQRLVR